MITCFVFATCSVCLNRADGFINFSCLFIFKFSVWVFCSLTRRATTVTEDWEAGLIENYLLSECHDVIGNYFSTYTQVIALRKHFEHVRFLWCVLCGCLFVLC